MSLKKSVIANYAGSGWQALMNFAFVPLYIKYLGMEAYGLIGIFAMLQVWLALLDMGMKPALGREMARFTAGAHGAQSIRNLLRSIELIGVAVAGLIAIGILAASGWLASHWVTAKHLPVGVVAHAFTVMGFVTALRFVQDIYVSCSVGLQRQVQQNIVLCVTSTLSGLGAVALLAWVSPTIGTFFLWQGLIAITNVALFAYIVYGALPPAPQPTRFSISALANIWRFAAGIIAITMLGLLLGQLDKILLSRLLTLESFGYYALAGVVASSLTTLVGPIATALFPRFTELSTKCDEDALRRLYHQGAQLVTVLIGSGAIVLITFGSSVLRLWTGNSTLSQKVAPLMAILAVSALCNGLMYIPYQLQLAYGWTTLAMKVLVVVTSLMVPAILWAIPIYGAVGAAWMLVMTNAIYLMLSIPLMHRRLLLGDQWRWCVQDVAVPLAAAAGTALLCHLFIPDLPGKIAGISMLLLKSSCVVLASALVAPAIRKQFLQFLRRAQLPLPSEAA